VTSLDTSAGQFDVVKHYRECVYKTFMLCNLYGKSAKLAKRNNFDSADIVHSFY